MTYFHPYNQARQVEFQQGSSQGCPTGGFAAILALHPCLHALAARFPPDKCFRIWAEFDDITIGGPKSVVFEVLHHLQQILDSTLWVNLNFSKCAIFAPQLHSVSDRDRTTLLQADLNRYPALHNIPICTDGIVLLGIPIGDCAYVRTNLATHLATIQDMGPRVLQLCNSYTILRIIRFCLNTKITHLLRALPPFLTLDFARDFDRSIMSCVAGLLNFNPQDESSIMTLLPSPADVQAQHVVPLSGPLRVLLAQHQIRLPESEGAWVSPLWRMRSNRLFMLLPFGSLELPMLGCWSSKLNHWPSGILLPLPGEQLTCRCYPHG
jgi:hypothetical protein